MLMLAGEPHVHVNLGAVVYEPRVGREFVAAARDQAHGLASAGENHVRSTRADAVRRHGNGLQSRAAETVDSDRGNDVGQIGAQGRLPRHIHARFRFRHGAAQNDIVNLIVWNLRIFVEQGPNGGSGQIVRTGIPQGPARRLTYGGAQTIHDDCFHK